MEVTDQSERWLEGPCQKFDHGQDIACLKLPRRNNTFIINVAMQATDD